MSSESPAPEDDRGARASWFVLPGQPLSCALGHPIPQVWQLPEDGFPRCPHHYRGGTQCDRRIYALVLPRRPKGRPLVLVADVTGQEIRELLERTSDVDEILTMLGLTDPRYGIRPHATRQLA